MPADYPAPSTNSAWHQQLYGARSTGDRFTPSNDNGSPPVVVFWSAHPGLQRKIDQATRRVGAPRSQTVYDCTGSFLTFPRGFAASGGAFLLSQYRMASVRCS